MRTIVTYTHKDSTYIDLWKSYYRPFFDCLDVSLMGDRAITDYYQITGLWNDKQKGLFPRNDLVCIADVDEFLVVNPDKYQNLGQFLDQVSSTVVRPTGYNVLQMPGDDSLDLSKPIMDQRNWWQRDGLYDKPLLLKKPHKFSSQHTLADGNMPDPDPDLVLLHLRDADIEKTKERVRKRGGVYRLDHLKKRILEATEIPDKWKLI